MTGEALRAYARSLVRASGDEKNLESVVKDLRTFSRTLTDNPELAQRLMNPLIPLRKRKEALGMALKGANDLAVRFADSLLRYYVLGHVDAILDQVECMRVESGGGLVADLILPGPVDQAQVEEIGQILKELTGREPRFTMKTDPSILGGFIVRSQSYLLDASMRGYLKKLTGGGLHGTGG